MFSLSLSLSLGLLTVVFGSGHLILKFFSKSLVYACFLNPHAFPFLVKQVDQLEASENENREREREREMIEKKEKV